MSPTCLNLDGCENFAGSPNDEKNNPYKRIGSFLAQLYPPVLVNAVHWWAIWIRKGGGTVYQSDEPCILYGVVLRRSGELPDLYKTINVACRQWGLRKEDVVPYHIVTPLLDPSGILRVIELR